MWVVALKGFAAMIGGEAVCVSARQVMELPIGADWVAAGLAEVVDVVEVVESATADAGINEGLGDGQRLGLDEGAQRAEARPVGEQAVSGKRRRS